MYILYAGLGSCIAWDEIGFTDSELHIPATVTFCNESLCYINASSLTFLLRNGYQSTIIVRWISQGLRSTGIMFITAFRKSSGIGAISFLSIAFMVLSFTS
jgi:hypothetical protein